MVEGLDSALAGDINCHAPRATLDIKPELVDNYFLYKRFMLTNQALAVAMQNCKIITNTSSRKSTITTQLAFKNKYIK